MLNRFLESVLRSELNLAGHGLLKLLKLFLQVLTYAGLIQIPNGPSLLHSTQKELSMETLLNIHRVISEEL